MRYVNECRRTRAIKKHDIAAYIWPAYTVEEPAPACSAPKAWENGSLCAPAKFPGRQWPRKPLWGYVNEADPYVMEMEIAAAADHGVNVFIYDWYWYDHRPFPEQCLDNGFLRAGNRDRMKFYLMLVNHDAMLLWDERNSHDNNTVVWDGGVTRAEFERALRMAKAYADSYQEQPPLITVNSWNEWTETSYYSDEENDLIDTLRTNIAGIDDQYKKASAVL